LSWVSVLLKRTTHCPFSSTEESALIWSAARALETCPPKSAGSGSPLTVAICTAGASP